MVDPADAGSLSAVRLRWRARFGFFLRAEAPVVGLGYPVPPRTAVLGMLAAVLGLPKDALATTLEGTRVALAGRCPPTHWHACNLRKIKDARLLPWEFAGKAGAKLQLSEESNTQSRQEWLVDPDFEVTAVLPEPVRAEAHARLREGRSHFTLCMGLSEMLASVELLSEETLTRLPEGEHRVCSVVRLTEDTQLMVSSVLEEKLRVLSLALPRSVTEDRCFSHENYLLAPEGSALPVRTSHAWQTSRGPVVFL